MSNSQPSTQSAAERRSAETQVRTLVAKFAPEKSRLIGAVRRWLRKRLPTAHELVYEYRDWFVISYSPNQHGYEGILAIRASTEGVKLYFNREKELPDPDKMLQGSGKQTRWMHLERASALSRPVVASPIDEAIALNRVPFASADRGPRIGDHSFGIGQGPPAASPRLTNSSTRAAGHCSEYSEIAQF